MASPSEPTAAPAIENVICPGCEEEIEVDRATARDFRCPYCNMAFVVEGDEEEPSGDPEGDAERLELERRRAEELDGLKIRQLSVLRRAEYRQRSYVITGLAACAIAVGQSIWMAHVHVSERGWGPRVFGFLTVTLIAVVLSVWLWRLFKRQTAMIAEHHAADTTPTREPDFSTLSDGQDRWERLNEVK